MANLKDALVKRLGSTLGVEHRPYPDRTDGFSSLVYAGIEFAHFHNQNELDLKLTKKIILQEGLLHPSNSVQHPRRSAGSQWIEVHFSSQRDLKEVERLVALAIERIPCS